MDNTIEITENSVFLGDSDPLLSLPFPVVTAPVHVGLSGAPFNPTLINPRKARGRRERSQTDKTSAQNRVASLVVQPLLAKKFLPGEVTRQESCPVVLVPQSSSQERLRKQRPHRSYPQRETKQSYFHHSSPSPTPSLPTTLPDTLSSSSFLSDCPSLSPLPLSPPPLPSSSLSPSSHLEKLQFLSTLQSHPPSLPSPPPPRQEERKARSVDPSFRSPLVGETTGMSLPSSRSRRPSLTVRGIIGERRIALTASLLAESVLKSSPEVPEQPELEEEDLLSTSSLSSSRKWTRSRLLVPQRPLSRNPSTKPSSPSLLPMEAPNASLSSMSTVPSTLSMTEERLSLPPSLVNTPTGSGGSPLLPLGVSESGKKPVRVLAPKIDVFFSGGEEEPIVSVPSHQVVMQSNETSEAYDQRLHEQQLIIQQRLRKMQRARGRRRHAEENGDGREERRVEERREREEERINGEEEKTEDARVVINNTTTILGASVIQDAATGTIKPLTSKAVRTIRTLVRNGQLNANCFVNEHCPSYYQRKHHKKNKWQPQVYSLMEEEEDEVEDDEEQEGEYEETEVTDSSMQD